MSPAELELLLRKLLGEGIQLQPASYLLLVVISLMAAAAGAFMGAYLKRRAENLATKADFDSLLTQLREQTREVEEIKSEIASAGWVHQRRWDLKRELYWQLLEVLEELKQKGRWLLHVVGDSWSPSQEANRYVETFAKDMRERGTVEKLLASKAVAGIILADLAVAAIDQLSVEYNTGIEQILSTTYPTDLAYFARERLPGLLRATEETYSMVLSASQQDLLDSPNAPTLR